MRVGSEGCGTIFLCKICEESDELRGQLRGVIQDERVVLWQEVPVVRIINVGKLPLHPRQNSVSGQAGDLGGLAENGAGHVYNDWVLGHLLENLPLADESPHEALVVIVQLILHLMLILVLKPSQNSTLK